MRYKISYNIIHNFPFVMNMIIIFLFLNCSKFQNQWHYSVNSSGLKELYTDTGSEILGIQCVSRLKFICASNEKVKEGQTMLSMEFTVSPYFKIKDFNFEKFEGPHAAAGDKKLMSITLSSKDRKTMYRVSQAGWISAEMTDGFTFGTSASVSDRNSAMRKIIHDILMGAENIEISVRDIKKDIAVSSVFSIGKGRDYFKEL